LDFGFGLKCKLGIYFRKIKLSTKQHFANFYPEHQFLGSAEKGDLSAIKDNAEQKM
jgi:hypothetical protein